MTLPSSGQLSFTDIQTEFGLTNPIGLDEYYRNSSFTLNSSIPTSGQISLSNFYGGKAATLDTFTPFANLGPDPTYAWYYITTGGKQSYSTEDGGTNAVDQQTWWGGVGAGISDYEVRVSNVSGTLLGDSTGVWLSLSTTRVWYIVTGFPGDSQFCSFDVEIRRGSTVFATATGNSMQVDSF